MTNLLLIFSSLLILHYGNVKTSTTVSPLPNIKSQPHCSKQGISCYDEHTIQYCNGLGNTGLEFTVSCKIQNPNRPLCVENGDQVKCETTQISAFDPLEICNDIGVHPDPTNCSRYIQCIGSKKGTNYFIVNCPSGSKYSIDEQKCSFYGNSCTTIHSECDQNPDKLIAYKPNQSIYVKCPASNSKNKIIVKSCKNEYHFNEEIGTCVQICVQEGLMPSYDNCKEFYNCVKKPSKYRNNDKAMQMLFRNIQPSTQNILLPSEFALTSNKCPTGTGFNNDTYMCDENEAQCTINN